MPIRDVLVSSDGASPADHERLAELSPVLLATADSDGRFSYLNDAWERTLGWSAPELLGRKALELVHPDDVAAVAELPALQPSSANEFTLDCRVATRDGGWRWLSWEVRYDSERYYGAGQDVTERKRIERALEAGDARLHALVDQVPAIVYTAALGEQGRWYFVSPQIEAMLGYRAEEFLAGPELWFASIHPDDRERVLADEAALEGPGDQIRSEYRVRTRDDRVLWLRDEGTLVVSETGELRLQGVMLDITDVKHAQEALLESEGKYRRLVETSQDVIWSTDIESRFTFVNDAVRHTHGYEPEEMIGRPFTDFQRPEVAERDENFAAEILAGKSFFQYETQHLRKDGTPVELSFNAVMLRDAAGEVIGGIGTARDITDRKRHEDALRDKHGQLQSIIDNSPLVIFAKDTERRYLIANHERESALGAKPGELIGRTDQEFLPAEVASTVEARDQEVLDTGRAIEVEEVLSDRTYMIQRFPLRGTEGAIYGVCGIATDITERKAREDDLRAKVEWSFRIRRAIEADRLTLHSQPIVELGSGRVMQEELLVRMLGEDGELVMPGDFLPPAERFGLAPAIDRWVISQAARLARVRPVEVNLSAQSIGDASLVGHIEAQLREAGAEPRNLVFEITETAAAADMQEARRLAERLAELGCRFAIDDFGTGYGSLTYLKHLPVSFIKIDMEFVRELTPDSPDQQVISSIVDVARNFGIHTVAEGVESAQVLELLEALGVDYAQGYHLGRPGPMAD